MGTLIPPLPPPPDERFRKLDEWLQKLHREHPVRFALLAALIAAILFGPVLLLSWWMDAKP